jgi:hypothetical protein
LEEDNFLWGLGKRDKEDNFEEVIGAMRLPHKLVSGKDGPEIRIFIVDDISK